MNASETYIDSVVQAMHVATQQLRELAQAGLAMQPADVAFDDVLAVLRSNLMAGELTLSVTWTHPAESPVITWRLTDYQQNLEARSLSALLRVFSAQKLQPDDMAGLTALLSPHVKESSRE